MNLLLEILKISGLGLLGILLYAFATIWSRIKKDGFSANKFFGENIPFWGVCLALNALLAIAIVVAPDFAQVLHFFGFAIESDNVGGFVLLGITLAAGSDKSMISGSKTLNSKTP